MSDSFSPLDADALVEHLGLAPHPEGGWYRETWRANSGPCADREDSPNAAGNGQSANTRARATAIMFLLKSDENSHWHRVDADELWIWQGGDPLDLAIAPSDARPRGAQAQTIRLGNRPDHGHQLQGLVPKTAWQAARPGPPANGALGYCLVSCVVVPGFEFSGFELAPPGWSPEQEKRV